jgi:hypothetical protein
MGSTAALSAIGDPVGVGATGVSLTSAPADPLPSVDPVPSEDPFPSVDTLCRLV